MGTVRARLIIGGVVVFALALSAFVVLRVLPVEHQLHKAQAHFQSVTTAASSLCTKAHPGTNGVPIDARTAAGTLRNAGMSPHPWDVLPPDQLVAECYPSGPSAGPDEPGNYVDAQGDDTAAPSISTAVRTCHGTTSTSAAAGGVAFCSGS